MSKKDTGRPRLFETVEELEPLIDAYFDKCYADDKPATMSGLAYSLGMDRRSLTNYSHKSEFFPALKKARDRVEASMEDLLLSGKATAGVIFSFKNNFGWSDKVEVDNISSDGSMSPSKIELVPVSANKTND
jgi:hypothetical protein